MKQLALLVRKIGGWVFGSLLLIVVGCLLAVLFFLMPVSFAFETFDLLVMDSKARGIVTNVDTKRHRGKSSTQITYEFQVDGRAVSSKNVFPGFLGNKGGFSRSKILTHQYTVGKKCDVHFDSSNPNRCALKFGWFNWSVGFTAAVWGLYLSWFFRSRSSSIQWLSRTFMFYGFGLLFVGPISVDLLSLHWHLAAVVCIAILVLIHQVAVPKRTPTDK